MKKNKKHQEIIDDYDGVKSKHLQKLADKMLKDDNKNKALRNKPLKKRFLNDF